MTTRLKQHKIKNRKNLIFLNPKKNPYLELLVGENYY